MTLASQVAAISADLAALSGAVTYRNLADQLKAAIAVAQQSGQAPIQITLPTGVSFSYASINVALLALETLERLAGEEAGGLAVGKMRLA